MSKRKATEEQEAVVYSREELMAAAREAFGVAPEVVAGALRWAGVEAATREEAADLVQRFLARQV